MPSQSEDKAPLIVNVAEDAHSSAREARRVTVGVRLSLVVNLFLFAVKLYAFVVSHSQSVLASLADSAVDIASQLVVFLCDRETRKVDPRFPIGKTKLQTVGAIIIACIMTLGAAQVIESCVEKLIKGCKADTPPIPDMGVWMFGILGTAVVLKAIMFLYCNALRHLSDAALVLAEDHRNDVLSNGVAIATSAIAAHVADRKLWWMDPAGGIAISLYIVWSWLALAKSQVNKIIGMGAPKDILDALRNVANEHNDGMEVDSVRAYHFGVNYFVEIDIVVSGDMTVTDSHDLAVDLQHKIEVLKHVERAFVHVDYAKRDAVEHKIDWATT